MSGAVHDMAVIVGEVLEPLFWAISDPILCKGISANMKWPVQSLCCQLRLLP